MALLKKIQGATLVETLISSVIIITVFVVGTISVNNVFYSAIVNDDFSYSNRIKELHYLTLHNKIALPFYEETSDWDIIIEQKGEKKILTGLLKKKDKTDTIEISED